MTLLALTCLLIGNVDRAEQLLAEALPVARALYPDDIQTVRALEGEAGARLRRGKPAEAIAPADEALSLAIRISGEESVDTALAYATAGEARRASGHPELALPLLRKARSIYEKDLGPDHPRAAALLSQEGLILLNEHKLATAEQMLTRATATLEANCPKCAVELSFAENALALVRLQQKRYREAGDLLARVVARRETYSSSSPAELASSLRLLAGVREKEKRYEEAATLSHRADVILGYR